ncbi:MULTISPECIES: hypothetical protein [unclassified Nonomuraea]|uniref:hypothetical protein n=1 Tax=unclassified Nonomuraea TaxID=2593643 RepID=UPI001486307F|nr:hypothetical protein [Nonomuraea sp. KC401]
MSAFGAWFLVGWAGAVGFSAAAAAGVVLAMIVSGRAGRVWVHLLAIGAGSVSLGVIVYVLSSDTTIYAAGQNLGPIELIALYVLLAVVVRWTVPVRVAVASAAVVWIACVVWVRRLVEYWPSSEPETGLSATGTDLGSPPRAAVGVGAGSARLHRP